jgi:2-methylcitrate dehydratase PrpD
MEVVLKSGARKSVQVSYQLGHWMNPMSDAQLDEKFRSLAGRHLSPTRTDALIQRLRTLEQAPRAGQVLELTGA